MPSVRRMILGHVMAGVCGKMNRRKNLQGDIMETPLKRCLSTFDITLLGKFPCGNIFVPLFRIFLIIYILHILLYFTLKYREMRLSRTYGVKRATRFLYRKNFLTILSHGGFHADITQPGYYIVDFLKTLGTYFLSRENIDCQRIHLKLLFEVVAIFFWTVFESLKNKLHSSFFIILKK